VQSAVGFNLHSDNAAIKIDCASKMPSSLAQFLNDSAFVGILPSKRAD
jgi:hypothetical protein